MRMLDGNRITTKQQRQKFVGLISHTILRSMFSSSISIWKTAYRTREMKNIPTTPTTHKCYVNTTIFEIEFHSHILISCSQGKISNENGKSEKRQQKNIFFNSIITLLCTQKSNKETASDILYCEWK